MKQICSKILIINFIIFCATFASTSVVAQELNISKIEYKGLKKTKPKFIKKVSSIKENTTTDSLKIQKDIQFLKQLPAIAEVSYELVEEEDHTTLIYNFEENFTIIPEVAIWTSVQQTTYRVGASEFNLFGQSIAVGGFYQNNGFNSYGFNFSAPYLFSNKLGLEGNYLNWTSREPVFFDEGTANYQYNNLSYEVIGLYRPNFTHSFRLGLNNLREQYDFIDGALPSDAPVNRVEDKLLLKAGYQYNNLNYFYYFVSGIKSELTVQSLLNNDEFNIVWNDFFYYKRLGKKGNLASRIRFGLATNTDSPFAPFALDNNVNIRGVGNVIDRGTGSFVTNFEYRRTLKEKEKYAIQGNAFVDFGTWRQPGGTFNDFVQSDNIRLYSGVGARIILKKVFGATFRIDYGINLQDPFEGGIVFGLGQYF